MSNLEDDGDCDLDILLNLLDEDNEDSDEESQGSHFRNTDSNAETQLVKDESKKDSLNMSHPSSSTMFASSSTHLSQLNTSAMLNSSDNSQPSTSSLLASSSIHRSEPNASVLLKSSSSAPSTSHQSSPDNSVNDLEDELKFMEQKMNKLKEELAKKKNIKTNVNSLSFTKVSSVIHPSSPSLETNVRSLSSAEKDKLLNDLKSKKSEIHSGDTDSEDDEDNRTPFEPQLSDCGRQIKRRMAHAGTSEIKRQENKGWKQAKGGSLVSLGKTSNSEKDEFKGIIDPFTGIRIINPLISSSNLKQMVADRRVVSLSSAAAYSRTGEIDGDWVTIGVIVSKSETKTSQKGSSYCIWQLSDLRDCTKILSLFLFSSAYTNLWKTVVGTVVGVLNAQIMKDSSKTDGRNVLTMSINTHEKVLIIGTAKDLGWCKGRNKEGSNCRQFVNKNVCEFCVFHIQREYQKMSSKRSAIQSSYSGVNPKNGLRNKVLGKDQVFYGGQLFSSGDQAKPKSKRLSNANKSTKDLSMLASLSTKLKADNLKEKDKKDSFILKHLSDDNIQAFKSVAKGNEALGQMLLAPSPGARNLLLHNTKDVKPKETLVENAAPVQVSSAQEFLKSNKPTVKGFASPLSKWSTPQLGRGLKSGQLVEIDVPILSRPNPAKERALSLVRNIGGIDSKERNMKRNREKAQDTQFQRKVKKRLRDSLKKDDTEETQSSEASKSESETAVATPSMLTAKRKSLLGSIDLNSDKFKALLNAKSNHTSLIQMDENNRLEEYYNTLEKKEMIENKMATIKEVPVTAVICLQCKYMALSANPRCKEESHPLKFQKAVKKFFECTKCKQRTISLDKLPGKACSNCSTSSWRRVSMAKEKTGPKLESEVLSLRGDELNHVSATSKDIYLHI